MRTAETSTSSTKKTPIASAKTVAKPSYSLIEYLHGMQGVSGSSPLGSIKVFASYTN